MPSILVSGIFFGFGIMCMSCHSALASVATTSVAAVRDDLSGDTFSFLKCSFVRPAIRATSTFVLGFKDSRRGSGDIDVLEGSMRVGAFPDVDHGKPCSTIFRYMWW
ncbi:hypothetical protein CC86DRAFT_184123 [Ophiobolus disseminans]|uniref:Secreted protein n=1 Tax=Ophiobolus disseminans TaxID=1469910 RepID=A0A6A7A6V1_9PLEO|nr:hypothetical protein CC86DRAFT_184123 [Ophiobolus disseminans]